MVGSKTDANGKHVDYTCNALGWLATRTWARGVTTTYGHNRAGDVDSVVYSDGTPGASGMTYDKGGRLATVTDASGERIIGYSPFGQRKTEAYTGSGILGGYTVTRDYDAQRRSGLAATGPDGFEYPPVSYAYNSGTRTITQGGLVTTYTPQPGMLQPATVSSAQSGGTTLVPRFCIAGK